MIIKANLGEMGTVLRALRVTAGMTLQQASEASGMSLSFISDIERGRTNPSLDTLGKLAHAYQATPAIVFTQGVSDD